MVQCYNNTLINLATRKTSNMREPNSNISRRSYFIHTPEQARGGKGWRLGMGMVGECVGRNVRYDALVVWVGSNRCGCEVIGVGVR